MWLKWVFWILIGMMILKLWILLNGCLSLCFGRIDFVVFVGVDFD